MHAPAIQVGGARSSPTVCSLAHHERLGCAAAVQPSAAHPSLCGRPMVLQQLSSRPAAAAPGASRQRLHAVAAADTAPAAGAAAPRLADLPMFPVLSVQGFILPDVPAGTEATVFAVYDQAKTLQYIGFSKDLRQSLRTVFGRRPDKTHQCRALHLPQLDQQQMVDVRAAWYVENAGPPPGNKLPAERAAWQAPATSFSISDRGKAAAAEELAKQMMLKIRSRGCKEEFIADPVLMEKGEVDFLPAGPISDEDIAAQQRAVAAAEAATRRCMTSIDGQPAPFDVFYTRTTKTNGGYMYDLRVTFQDKESSHRVIVGKDYYERQGVEPQVVVEQVFGFLLRKKVPRKTEGMLVSSQFPTNYFSVSEVHQFFDDFEADFEQGALPGDNGFWRFNRTQDYGYKGANETQDQLTKQFAKGWKAGGEDDGSED